MKNVNKGKNKQITHFVNLSYYLKRYLGKLPEPPLNPATQKPIDPKDLLAIFAEELVKQEGSLEEKIEIPSEVQEIYSKFRPTPLIRAKGLEKFLKTPAHIYYKYEGATLTGSHKINTALVQAYYAKKQGIKTLSTETGAGQWGTALAVACSLFGLKCKVFMVRVSYDQKPYRKYVMKTLGADIVASPSKETEFGKSVLAKDKNCPGSLGIAISEALEYTIKNENTKYALGSVLNHVLLHQTVVGQEVKRQMEEVGEYPDVVVGCVGGGSNFTGFATPFIIDKISGKKPKLRILGVEASSCPKMTKGKYRYDFGDTAKKTPLLMMQTLGCEFIPKAIHAGGLRYHGNAPILSFLNEEGISEAKSYPQEKIFQAGIDFARAEGIIPAPESAHAVKAVMDEALKARKEGVKRVIVFNLSGHGLLDMLGYEEFMEGKLKSS